MHEPLARKLRVLRAERGWTLNQAAERAGVQPETISDAEHGKRRPYTPTLTKIAKGYGVPVEELLEEPVLAGKAEAPPTGLEGWIERALEEDHFAAAFGLAKFSQEDADKLHRTKIKESDEKRVVVRTLRDHHAAPDVILEKERELVMLSAQATAAGLLSIEMSRGREVSDLDPREIVADVIQTQRELFSDQQSSVLENTTLAQDADTAG